uniref:DUF4219 domain-containing protein n=1 Tax=Physcomitrium patens TaxID=3218 RepID=A0A2K1L2N7_PHYPA|nr:hypothetical protein PHYPA_003079 [Physcomitrium patens]
MSNLETICSKEPMLTGPKNYKHWAITLQSIFEKEDLWDFIEPQPITTASSSTDPPSKTEFEQPNTDVTRWRKRRAKAMIQLSLTPDLRYNIIDIPDQRDAWQALSTKYPTNTISDIMVVLNCWENFRMGELQDLATFIQQLNDIIRDLIRDLKSIKQSNEVVIHKILNRLPCSFDKLVSQIQFEKEIPSLQELWNRLHMEETNAILRDHMRHMTKHS